MMSFCASPSPGDVFDEIWELIESVSEGFLTYFCNTKDSDQSSGKSKLNKLNKSLIESKMN